MPGLADGEQVNPAAACSAADPSLGAPDRMSGMVKCQAVKAGVLSRGRSHVPKDMARGTIGPARRGEVALKPACPSQPRKSGKPRPGSELLGTRDRALKRVKGGATALPGGQAPSAKRRSASQPNGWWVNSPLEADRGAIVAVPVQ